MDSGNSPTDRGVFVVLDLRLKSTKQGKGGSYVYINLYSSSPLFSDRGSTRDHQVLFLTSGTI